MIIAYVVVSKVPEGEVSDETEINTAARCSSSNFQRLGTFSSTAQGLHENEKNMRKGEEKNICGEEGEANLCVIPNEYFHSTKTT